jgi:hypothetical protein
VSPLARVRAAAVAVLSACAVATAALPTSAGAAIRTLRVGAAPRLPGSAHALDSLPATARLQLTIALRPRDPDALAAYASAVSTPGSADEHRYLTPAEFRQLFGASAAEIATVDAALRARGLDPEPASADGLLVPLEADAGAIAHALGVHFERYRLASGRLAYANTAAPRFTTSVASLISGVVGLDDIDLPHAVGLAMGRRAKRAARLQPHVVTDGPQPCSAATTVAPSWDAYTADQLASAYNFSSLYASGDLGAGETVALLELSNNSTTDISGYQTCYGTSAAVSDVSVDGGAASSTTVDGEAEATLDIENVIGLAPDASIDVYQAPNSGVGVLEDYAAIFDNPSVSVVSTSWGECEADAGSAVIGAEATLFEQAATEGKSVFAAAGDQGSNDCYTGHVSDPVLAVDDPASQPDVTGVGGLTLSSTTYPPSETAWNDSPTSHGAGGGGVSSKHAMPSYQASAPSSLEVINSNSSGTPCGAGAGSYCREVPDVSADGDPATGYLIYFEGGWMGVGGTSAAAPLWAAFAALTNASGACHGTAIGFANPGLYAAAGSAYTSDFTDVTSGDNAYTPSGYAGVLYPAGAGYDMTSGLGSPNGATLPAALCASNDKVTLEDPGSQSSTIGQAVSLQLSATDLDGDSVSFAATGLPAGLSISAGGMITGTPTTPTFAAPATVTVTATATSGATAQTSFTWNIVEPPPVTPQPPAPTTTQVTTTQAPATPVPTPTTTTPTATPPPVPSCTDGQLLSNGGFESGARGWSATGHVIVDRKQAKGSETPRAGNWLAWLGGHASQHTATLSQTVTIPAACTTATLTFWRHIDSTRRRSEGVADMLRVQLVSSAGTVLKTLATYSNRNAARGYRRASFNFAVAPGEGVSIRFTATLRKRGAGTTDFCLDDTAFAVT